MTRIIPNLWYSDHAEEAARFYVSVVPDSRIDHITTMPVDTPSGPAGTVKIVEFTLAGRAFLAFSPDGSGFSHAVSLMIECDTQDEIDRLWGALSDGGTPQQCGWLRDRYGFFWQIVPTRLQEMMRDSDRAAAARVAKAMFGMAKLDLAALEAAFRG